MQKAKRIIKWAAAAVIIVIAADAAAVFYFANTQSQLHQADAIIIMGAAINSPAIYNRTQKALELYEESLAPVLVLSGGRISEEDVTEATYMQRVLQANTGDVLNLILEEELG